MRHFRLSVPARCCYVLLLLSATACAFQLKEPVEAALGKDSCEATINAERSKRRQSDEPRELGPVQLSEDGHFVVAALNDGVLSRLLAFDANTGNLRWDKPLDAPAVALAVNAVNDEVAVAFRSRPCKARQNPHIERWRLQTGVAIIPALKDAGELSSLRADSAAATVYTGDGKFLVAALRNAVRVWDVSSGKNRLAIQPPGFDRANGVERVTDIADSQDARIIAGAGETSVLLWDGVSGKLLRRMGSVPNGSIQSVLLSSDGKLVAVQDAESAAIYLTGTGQQLQRLAAGISPVRFLPTDDLILNRATVVQLWSYTTHKIQLLSSTPVPAIFVTLDGRVYGLRDLPTTLSPSSAATLRLIDVRSGQALGTMSLPGR